MTVTIVYSRVSASAGLRARDWISALAASAGSGTMSAGLDKFLDFFYLNLILNNKRNPEFIEDSEILPHKK